MNIYVGILRLLAKLKEKRDYKKSIKK
jgi:hypothetical protein